MVKPPGSVFSGRIGPCNVASIVFVSLFAQKDPHWANGTPPWGFNCLMGFNGLNGVSWNFNGFPYVLGEFNGILIRVAPTLWIINDSNKVVELVGKFIWPISPPSGTLGATLWMFSGWWYTCPSEKYESQLGWLFPIYGKIKHVPNHQPVSFV